MGSITYFNEHGHAVGGVEGHIVWPEPPRSFLPPQERNRAEFNRKVDELMKNVKLPEDTGRTYTRSTRR